MSGIGTNTRSLAGEALLSVDGETSRSLRVLFVTNMYPEWPNPSSGTFVQHQAEYLRRAGHRVDVLNIGNRRSKLKYLTAAFDVLARTRATSYDIVHAHYGLSGIPALFCNSAPLVVTLHGSDALIGHIQPWISKSVCSMADAVIVVSKGIASRIAGEIIPCGIDMEVFRPRGRPAARARLGLPMNVKLVLFPFDPKRKIKRFELAKAAVDSLGDPNVQMLVIGSSPNSEMPWYYSAADVMILSSASEGSPTSVKEALACNVPVVSTNVGDVPDIMQGIRGCAICEGDSISLARGLRSVLDQPAEPPFDGRSLMLRYDHGQTVTALVRVYEQAIQGYLVRRETRKVGRIRRLLDGRSVARKK